MYSLPHRMMYQKMSLLSMMVEQYINLGRREQAVNCMNQLIEARTMYLEFSEDMEHKHCLMFPEGDDDGIWHVTPEKVNAYVANAFEKLAQFPELQGAPPIAGHQEPDIGCQRHVAKDLSYLV